MEVEDKMVVGPADSPIMRDQQFFRLINTVNTMPVSQIKREQASSYTDSYASHLLSVMCCRSWSTGPAALLLCNTSIFQVS